METKKTKKADLQNKRSIALLAGLVISMALVIGIFSWSQKEKVLQEITFTSVASDTELPPVVTVDKEQPTMPKLISFSQKLILTSNTAIVDEDPQFLENLPTDILTNITATRFTKPETSVVEEIPVIHAEEMPTFQGGDINTFRNWCAANIIYPSSAQDNNVHGRIILSFVIERDGTVSNVKILRGADSDLNAEAVRVVSSSPKWNPGKNRGKAVRFTFNMPIDFVLQ